MASKMLNIIYKNKKTIITVLAIVISLTLPLFITHSARAETTPKHEPVDLGENKCGYEETSSGDIQYYDTKGTEDTADDTPANPNDSKHGSPRPKECTGQGTVNECGDGDDPCKEGTRDVCGKGAKETETKFNFGCLGKNYPSSNDVSPLQDLAFAFVRFFSAGVGLVVVIAVIIAGFRYSAAQANPQATAAAIAQIRNALIGLLIYIFMYALIQFLVPGGAFQ